MSAEYETPTGRKLRVVPPNPDPIDFPFVPHACDVAPSRCPDCTMSCPLGFQKYQRKEKLP